MNRSERVRLRTSLARDDHPVAPSVFTLVRESSAVSRSEARKAGRGLLNRGGQMTATAIAENGGKQPSKLIRVRDGGVVGISKGRPGARGGRPMTALHVHGYEGLEELSDAEVRLEVDELAHLVRELADRLPDEQRLQIADYLGRPPEVHPKRVRHASASMRDGEEVGNAGASDMPKLHSEIFHDRPYGR